MNDQMGRLPAARRGLRIALLAPPLVPVPPPRYGGTERVVGLLAEQLHQRGHDVTVFAAGDSGVSCRLVPVVPRALWANGPIGDPREAMLRVAGLAMGLRQEFDVIHAHLEGYGFELARRSEVPVVTTLHGRLDCNPTAQLLDRFRDVPLVSISQNQRRWHGHNNWLATIYHGVDAPTVEGRGDGGYLCFVGRVTPEKGVVEAIELARRSGLRLLIGAKVKEPDECEMYERLVVPAERAGVVEFLGELDARQRDELYGGALATLMLGAWPEPFGLVAAESMAVGTPVIARRVGALVETVRHGIDGYGVDDVDEALHALGLIERLDRAEIRRGARRRFSAQRMADDYEAAYARLIEGEREPVPAMAALAARPALAAGGWAKASARARQSR